MEQDILMILKDFGEQEKTDNWGNKVKGMKINDIHTELLRRSYTPTIESVTKMCTGLMEIGYIIRNEEVKPHRYSINPELKREYKVFIDWNEIVATCKESVRNNLPQIYDEYVRRFCQGEGLKVIDPFTGEQKNILDSFIKEESRKPINSGVVTKDLNTREDWQKTGSSNLLRTSDKDDISIEISIEDNVSSSKLPTSSLYQVGKKDVKDEKQDKILEVLIDNKTFTLEEISERIKLSLDMTEELLNYLISIAEVYKKNNYYGRLN
jgi:hypothetical protein